MYFNVIVVCLVFGAVVNAVSVQDVIAEEWNLFKIKYGKTYQTLFEEKKRFQIFKENKYRIAEHNKLFARKEVTYEMGINHFSDMLPNEITNTMPGLTADLEEGMNEIEEYNLNVDETSNIPIYFDWRQKRAVSGVKAQGNCSSDWAFATTGVVESLQAIKMHKYSLLSEQNLVDCSKENSECHGGWPVRALQYVLKNKGIDSEIAYPYKAKYNRTCNFKRNQISGTIRGIRKIRKGDERALLSVVYHNGPVAVSLNADGFHNYRSGVYNNTHCATKPNHSVLVVGFGAEGPQEYWIVKNSWGIHWGEQGYIKIARNKNMCGIADNGVFPVV